MGMPALASPRCPALGLGPGDRVMVPPHWEPGTVRGRVRTVATVRFTDPRSGLCKIHFDDRAPLEVSVNYTFRRYHR